MCPSADIQPVVARLISALRDAHKYANFRPMSRESRKQCLNSVEMDSRDLITRLGSALARPPTVRAQPAKP
jgi:hypothetical protein